MEILRIIVQIVIMMSNNKIIKIQIGNKKFSNKINRLILVINKQTMIIYKIIENW